MKRFLPSLLIALGLLATTVVQLGVIDQSRWLSAYCFLPLILIHIVFIISQSAGRTLLTGLAIGWLISLFSVIPFTAALLSFTLATMTLIGLGRYVFQHPTTTTAVLSMMAMTTVYHTTIFLAVVLLQTIGTIILGDIVWWASIMHSLGQVIVHALIILLAALIIQRFTTRVNRSYQFDSNYQAGV